MKFVLKLCGGLFVLSLFVMPFEIVMPFVISYAQENMADNKKDAEKERQTQNSAPQDEIRKAQTEVRKSVAGGLTLDKITARESNWELRSALAAAKVRSDDPTVINMTFYKSDYHKLFKLIEYKIKLNQ